MDKTLTLALMVKDESSFLANCIESVETLVNEVVVLDTGSTDNTVDIGRMLGARVYKTNFRDFGSSRTLACHLSRCDWVLSLDADEIMAPEYHAGIKELVNNKDGIDAWLIPERHWLDLDRNKEVWKNKYPDLHLRLFENRPEIQYVRAVHEVLVGYRKAAQATNGVHIDHFGPSVPNIKEKLTQKFERYKSLMQNDKEFGHTFIGPGTENVWTDPNTFLDWNDEDS